MFVPSWDIIWRSSILVHGILVEVAGVEVWLDGGKDGDLQGALTEAWRETMECENNNNNNNNATTNLPSWNHQTICVSECLECHLSDNPVSLRCYLWRMERLKRWFWEFSEFNLILRFWDSENSLFAGTFTELPAKLLNEFLSSGGDVSWEVDGINAL